MCSDNLLVRIAMATGLVLAILIMLAIGSAVVVGTYRGLVKKHDGSDDNDRTLGGPFD